MVRLEFGLSAFAMLDFNRESLRLQRRSQVDLMRLLTLAKSKIDMVMSRRERLFDL
jgi:hypothetical protein